MTPILTVQNLTKRFGPNTALDTVSFKLKAGEITGLLGLNGAGKSTALSLLTGRLLADAGDIRFASETFGYVPEGAPVFEDLTISAHLDVLAGLANLSKAERDASKRRVLEQFELSESRHKVISTLSKGYRRRVALSGAFLGNPPLLFLDEPTDGLDPIQKERVLGQLRASREQRALLISTHSLEDVEAICDRVLVLKLGRLVFDGTLEALRELGGSGGVPAAFKALNTSGALS